MSNLFSENVVTAVTRHMNGDHADDNVLIVRALGGRDSVTGARMTDMDATGVTFVADVDGDETLVRIPWQTVPRERVAIRQEVVRMYRDACERLGLEPREGEG